MLAIWGPLFAWLHPLSKLTFPFPPLCSPWYGWSLWGGGWVGSLNGWVRGPLVLGDQLGAVSWPSCCVWSEWGETMGLGGENPSLARCLTFKGHSTWWKKISSKGMRRKMCVTKQCLTQSSPPSLFPSFHFTSCSLVARHRSLWGHEVFHNWSMTAAQAFIVTGKLRGATRRPPENHFSPQKNPTLSCYNSRMNHCWAANGGEQKVGVAHCSCCWGRLVPLTNSSGLATAERGDYPRTEPLSPTSPRSGSIRSSRSRVRSGGLYLL